MSNENQIRIYDSSGATPISDPDHLLDRVEQIRFSTVYPGGIFENASFFIPCDVTRTIPIKHANRLQIKNGLLTVFEGMVSDITLVIGGDNRGIVVDAVGYWALALRRYKYNRWIDRRYISNIYGVWTPLISLGAGNKCTPNQDNQLLFTPKSVEWIGNDIAYIQHVANGSSNVKRIKFSYDLQLVDVQNPVRAKKYTAIGTTYSANLPNMIDGLTTTTQTVSMATSDYLYIGITDPRGVTGFRFDFGATVNGNAAVLSADQYGVDTLWHAVTITADGTSSGGKTWARDGDVTFAEIEGWDMSAVNGTQKFYFIRFYVNAGLTANVVINNIQILRTQAWTLGLYDGSNAAVLWSVNAAGTGTQDITLSPTAGTLYFYLASNAKQIPPAVGQIYGKITDLACVAESWDGTSQTTVSGILSAMVHYLGGPFADNYQYIAPNTYDLLTTGFVQDDLQLSIGEQMIKVGTYIAGNAPTSVGCLESDAISGNTSVVVYYETQPTLTDYEYAVRVDEKNLAGLELVLSAGTDVLQNTVWVRHSNDSGKQQWSNQSDDAGLADSASATKYEGRTLIVDGKQASTTALGAQYGLPFVTKHKDLQYYMRGPLAIKGTIRTKAGVSVPVSQVRAGKRIRIENFATDVGDTVASGLTFLITHTDYDDETQTCQVTCGVPDDITTLTAMNGTVGVATRT